MNDDQKQVISQTCKRHTTKFTDREFGRTCPSRLSKRELENLYFSLLDNNLELKQTVNSQNEKIKQLSTRVQRLSNIHKTSLGKSDRECSTNEKTVIKEQKEIIADQKRAIDRLSERVKILNMRLCSAKQFLGRNSARCNRCCLGMNISVKNSTISGLNSGNKKSTSNLQNTGALNEIINKNSPNTISMEVQTDYQNMDNGQKICDENKCKTLMEELKRKVVALEEELSKAHEDYSKRVSKLEREVLTLRQSNGEKHFTMQQSEGQMEQLMQLLRTAEMKCDDINLQLSMEKRKVSELETRLKAADLSAQVAKTVEHHLKSKNMAKLRADYETSSPRPDNIRPMEEQAKTKRAEEPKNSDDSGYMEAVLLDERKSPAKDLNSELREKMLDLQTQLNSLKRLAALEKDKRPSNFEPYEMAIEDDQVSLLRSINDYSTLMKASPIVAESDCNKSGDICDIKRPESLIMQPKGQDSFNIRASEQVPVTNPSNVSNPGTYKTNSLENAKGVSDKFEVSHKTNKKDEKMPKSVSYENFITDNRKNIVKDTFSETEGHSPIRSLLGRASSDEKHNVKIDQGSSTSYLMEKMSSKKSDRDDHQKLSSDQTRGIYDFKSEKRSTDEKKLEFDKLPHNNEGSSVKENIGKGGKKISIDLPESDIEIEKPCTIEVIKSDSSYDRTPKNPTVIPFSESGEMKVLKEDRASTDLDLPKVEKVDNVKKRRVSGSDLMATNQTAKKPVPLPEKKIDKCKCRTRICTCPLVQRRDVNVYRTGSGTARFETVTTSACSFRQCLCFLKSAQTNHHNVASESQTPHCQNASDGTYVVGVPSPRDTDGEISGLTDLPDERDESPRNVLSPGEERITYTNTYTSTTDVTLSEGELPVSGGGRKSISPGERKWKRSSGEISPEITTSQRMEVALQAVSEELARCRQMLQRQRPQARGSREVSSMTSSVSDSITLSKTEGQERIVSDHSHSSRFTLHVGNIVLSDQALKFSRGKALVLAWRFYDQPPAMTRMNPGRVLHFDFTTEYRLPFTSHFLEYMTRDEMLLTICEIEKPEEALASCALPLSGALKHINRRVYLSLTLYYIYIEEQCSKYLREHLDLCLRLCSTGVNLKVASPKMLGSRVSITTMDHGDEVGVVDVWCRLKVGSALLPSIQKEAHQSPDVTATSSVATEEASASNAPPTTHREVVQKIIASSAQDVRRAVAREIQTPSKLRMLLRDLSDCNSIYSIYRNNKRKVSKKLSDGQKKSVTIEPERNQLQLLEAQHREIESKIPSEYHTRQTLDITVVWLALKEGCDAMARKDVQRLYVAYSFLGKEGAELETPVSLPKPKKCTEKCYFNFKKTFQVNECDLPLLGHMVKCKLSGIGQPSHRDCLTFTVISEPPDDPLGLATCEDIGYAHLYLGDVLSRCESSDSYTDVVSVKEAQTSSACGVLAVRVAGLQALKNLW